MSASSHAESGDTVNELPEPGQPVRLQVEIWSDVVCPWCFIGKRRFERAVEELRGAVEVEVVYRPYQLDPRAAPGGATPVFEAYSKKFGGPQRAREIIDHVTSVAATEGIDFRMDQAIRANTYLAHRLLSWALTTAGPQAQHELKERLLDAYFTNGEHVGDPDLLADVAGRAGLDRSAARAFLASDEGATELHAELTGAAELGITAVPTFVIEGRFQIPGAQDTDVFVRALTRMAEIIGQERRDHADSTVGESAAASGEGCDEGACQVSD